MGETGQHYCDRRKQHQVKNKKTTNGISEHLRHNLDHEINWGKIIFLDKDNHWKGRKLKETMYINALNPSVTTNPSKIMNLEKGFKLNPIWSEFNSIFRSYIREKVER